MFVYDLLDTASKYGSEWYLPYFDGFTGPNYSDGKMQGSVPQGSFRPKGKLGYLSREHDARYATATSLNDLDWADEIYFQKTRDMSLVPRIIGALPKYGNAAKRFIARLNGDEFTGEYAHQNKSFRAGKYAAVATSPRRATPKDDPAAEEEQRRKKQAFDKAKREQREAEAKKRAEEKAAADAANKELEKEAKEHKPPDSKQTEVEQLPTSQYTTSGHFKPSQQDSSEYVGGAIPQSMLDNSVYIGSSKYSFNPFHRFNSYRNKRKVYMS